MSALCFTSVAPERATFIRWVRALIAVYPNSGAKVAFIVHSVHFPILSLGNRAFDMRRLPALARTFTKALVFVFTSYSVAHAALLRIAKQTRHKVHVVEVVSRFHAGSFVINPQHPAVGCSSRVGGIESQP
jgi:hypothetical protein